MKIDFEKNPQDIIANFKGGEKNFITKMYTDSSIKIMHGRLEDGATIGFHTHETSSEIIFVLEGNGKVICDSGEEILKAGDCHYCPKGCGHSLQSLPGGFIDFFAVVPEL